MSLDLIATIYGENAQGGTTEAPVALTGVDSVQVCGNNLLPDSAKTVTGDNIRYFYNTDGFLLLKGQAYTLVTNINSAGIYIKSSDDSSEIAVRFQAKSVTYIPDTNVRVFFDVYWLDGVPDGALVWLNLGESPLPYEPYQGSVTQLPIQRPLHKVGDVRDVCRTRVKSVYDKRIVLDGTENWTEYTNKDWQGAGYHVYKFYDADALLGQPIVSNKYPSRMGAINFKGTLGVTSGTQSILFSVVEQKTVEDWKAYLAAQKAAGTPLIIYRQSTAYDGTNGLDVCLAEYQTGFAELDGKNVQAAYNPNNGRPYGIFNSYNIIKTSDGVVCSQAKTEHGNLNWGYVYASNVSITDIIFGLIGSDITSRTELNAYLTAQKSAGTPVQIAYQLATPEVYATDPVDIFVETIFPIVVSDGPITYKVVAHMHPFKTDWKVQPKTVEGYYNGDWFEIEDYNSILDNYQTIYKIAKALYPDLQIPTFVSPTLGAPTKASEINTIERTIDAFKTLTIALSDVGATKTWLDNGNLFNFEDINRWEQVALSYYTVFLGQVELLPKLQFKLGGAQF